MSRLVISASTRQNLAKVLKSSDGVVTPRLVTRVLRLKPHKSAALLSRWNKQGWIKRMRRGFYIPVPMASSRNDVGLDNAYVAATKLFSPCYIGGWSAVEHWGLTEQTFRTVMVMTAAKPRHTSHNIGSTKFKLKSTSKKMFFDLKPRWYGQNKVYISSPHKTMADVLLYPHLCGGMREVNFVFLNYIKSNFSNLHQLIKCCRLNGKGVAFKRLGFLLELNKVKGKAYVLACQRRMSAGYSKIDSQLKCDKVLTRWRLRMPASWKKRFKND